MKDHVSELKAKLHNAEKRVKDAADAVAGRLSGDDTPAFVTQPTIVKCPNPTVPLVAVASFCALGSFHKVIVRAVAGDHIREQTIAAMGHKLELPFWGLRAGRAYTVTVGLVGADVTIWSEPASYRTPKLEDALPQLTLKTAMPASMEPGVVLFSVGRYPGDETAQDNKFSLLVIVDAEGKVVWYYKDGAGAIEDARMLNNGNLLFNRGPLEIAEMRLDGEIQSLWAATGHIPKASFGAVRTPVDAFHHEIYPIDDDTFLVLTSSLRKVPNFPTSTEDCSAPTETADVVGDAVVEFQRSGQIRNSIELLDVLIPTRIGYNSLDHTWDKLYPLAKGGTRDWAHANAVIYDARDNTVIVSARHQDALVKLRRDTGEVIWILGENTDWGPLSERVLRPIGDTAIPYHAHAPAITARGTLLLWDNGNYRARPYKERLPATKNRSRAVELRIDEEAGTFEEVWAFAGNEEDSFYTPFIGDADPMPQTGNVLITQGGIVESFSESLDDPLSGHHRAAIWEVTHEAKPTVVFHLSVGDTDQGSMGWHVYRSEKLSSW